MSSEPKPPSYTVSSQRLDLPTYQDVERNGQSPPSYESLFGRVKAIKETSDGNVDFVKKTAAVLLGTIGFTIFLGFSLAIPITMIVIGAKYKDDCPEEEMIPIYLIVGGSVALGRCVMSIIRRCCTRKKEDGEENEEGSDKKCMALDGIIDCFQIAWFIAGNVWVYRSKGDISDDPTADNYCHPTLYWFAFWLITASYIMVAASIFCCCFCCGIFACCAGAKAAKAGQDE